MSIVGQFDAETGWEAILLAIHKWVRESSGLNGRTVVWDYQQGKRPQNPYAVLSISDLSTVGHDWKRRDDNPTPTAGQEIRTRHRGHRMATLVIEVYGSQEAGQTALPVLSDVVSGLGPHEYELDQAGIGIGEIGAVRVIGSTGSVLEPRARCEVQLHLASELVSYNTYIEFVQLNIVAKDPAGETLESREVWVPEEPPP